MQRSIYFRLSLVVAVVLAAQVAACGGDDGRTKKAAKWLKNYSQMNPPNGDWVTTSVKADSGDKVVMDVLVPYKQHVDQIKSRTKIEQAHIVTLACPPKDAEIWTILSSDQMLWINLTARTESGLTEVLIGASCKR